MLAANYLKERLKQDYDLPHDRTCMHEVVFSDKKQKALGATAMDICKRLMDFGFHPPTVYFPLVVPGALMIEPPETVSRQELDEVCGRVDCHRAGVRRRHGCGHHGASHYVPPSTGRDTGGEASRVAMGPSGRGVGSSSPWWKSGGAPRQGLARRRQGERRRR